MARDEAAGAAQVQVLADAARSLGHQWARTPGDRPGFAAMLSCLGAWLGLEEDAAQERGEALDAMLSTQPHSAEGAAARCKTGRTVAACLMLFRDARFSVAVASSLPREGVERGPG